MRAPAQQDDGETEGRREREEVRFAPSSPSLRLSLSSLVGRRSLYSLVPPYDLKVSVTLLFQHLAPESGHRFPGRLISRFQRYGHIDVGREEKRHVGQRNTKRHRLDE
jgi:GDP-D-mannose dehydratase